MLRCAHEAVFEPNRSMLLMPNFVLLVCKQIKCASPFYFMFCFSVGSSFIQFFLYVLRMLEAALIETWYRGTFIVGATPPQVNV